MDVIDLHTHSSCSDGTDSPTELVRKAHEGGVTTLGLTDHDTTAGWFEAAKALPKGMRLVRGAEISTHAADGRGGTVSAHLLGYLFRPDDAPLAAEMARLQEAARTRTRTMVRRMRDVYGADRIDVEETLAGLPQGVAIGRQHLATVLVEKGLIKEDERTAAFSGVLAKDGPIYVAKASTPIEDAIRLIDDAGGVAVFAHPWGRRKDGVVELSELRRLAGLGLRGVEVDHPQQSPADRATLRALADELKLIVTGSSDYHGTNKTTAIAAETTSEDMLERLVGERRGVEILIG